VPKIDQIIAIIHNNREKLTLTGKRISKASIKTILEENNLPSGENTVATYRKLYEIRHPEVLKAMLKRNK